MSEGEGELRRRLEALQRRLEHLEARLEAVDESFIRHQAQNETDLEHLQRTVDRVGQEINGHQDAHWRSGR